MATDLHLRHITVCVYVKMFHINEYNKNFGLTQNSFPHKTEYNRHSEFVKETEWYDTNIKESAASRASQETGKREKSYKDSTFMNTTRMYPCSQPQCSVEAIPWITLLF